MKVYVAGPIFTPEDRARMLAAAERVRGAGHEPVVPFDADRPFPEAGNRREVFNANLETLRGVDVVLALLEGVDVDSGAGFELGYAHARGIPIIGVRTDYRSLGDEGVVNLMIAQATDVFIHEPRGLDAAWDAVAAFLEKPARSEIDELVRDKLPAILRSDGRDVSVRRVEGIEYARYLKRRILLEAEALLSANEVNEKEEAADLLEALSALQDLRKWAPESLRRVKEKRSESLGGFRLGYVLAASDAEGMAS